MKHSGTSKRRLYSILCMLMIVGIIFSCLHLASFPSLLPDYLKLRSHQNASDTALVTELTKASAKTFWFEYLINAKDICRKDRIQDGLLMIVVCSAVKNLKLRQAIRETWGSIASKNNNTGSVRIAFFLGATTNENDARRVEEEASIHRDIIQLDFLDTYRNLTYKTISMLHWIVEDCPDAKYVHKIDDDMYANIPDLLSDLARFNNRTNFIYGILYKKAEPFRNQSYKWHASMSEYPERFYPNFVAGGGSYVISGDAVPKLFAASQNVTFFWLEDVFVTGLCARRAGVKRLNAKKFSNWKIPATGCSYRRYITGHEISVPEMHNIWKELQNNSLSCQ